MTVWLVISSNVVVAETADEAIARQLYQDLQQSGANARLAQQVEDDDGRPSA